MALSLKNLRIPSSGASNSWTDFYINVTNKQIEHTLLLKKKLKEKIKSKAGETVKKSAGLSFIIDAQDAWWFANVITDEYDKLMKNGKTLIGGVPVDSGNKKLMALTLTRILVKTQKSKKGDLLRDIGPAVQAYWTGARLSKFPPPKMPCIGAVQNINTITALNLSPGVWTPVTMGPQGSNGPFLLNFILSASLHLLTVGGFFNCNCQYPPPAPPAPGMLPWVGYFVKPFSGKPLSGFDFKTLLKYLGIGAGAVLGVSAIKALANLLMADGKKKTKKQRKALLDSIFKDRPELAELRKAVESDMESADTNDTKSGAPIFDDFGNPITTPTSELTSYYLNPDTPLPEKQKIETQRTERTITIPKNESDGGRIGDNMEVGKKVSVFGGIGATSLVIGANSISGSNQSGSVSGSGG